MSFEPESRRSCIENELHLRGRSITPQALTALVSTVTKASPEVAGDSDSLLLGLLSTGSYTVDLLRDAGANIRSVSYHTDSSATNYFSPANSNTIDPVRSLFSEQANIASLFSREEFETRPIEAADLLQHAISPISEVYTDDIWLFEQDVSQSIDHSKLRLYSDIEILVKETLEELLSTVFENFHEVLAARIKPLNNREIRRMLDYARIDEQLVPLVLNALNLYILDKTIPVNNSPLITFCAKFRYTATFAAQHFMSSGGDYAALATSLRIASRFAPERDHPILGITEVEGTIIIRPFSYRGTAAYETGTSNTLFSVTSQCTLPLIEQMLLTEFEYLINRPSTSEPEIQRFLEANPEIIRSLGYSRCIPHVVLSEAGKGDLIPDFILQRPGGSGFDILDLKLPDARMAATSPFVRISHEITKAVAQLRAYANFFKTPINKDRFVRKHNIEYLEPKLIVAIGRRSQFLNNEMRLEIEGQAQGVRLLTYDELIDYAKTRTVKLK